MGYNFNISFGRDNTVAERDNQGNWFYHLLGGFGSKSKFKSEQNKLEVVLSNPAILKVLAFSADVASMAQINQKVNNNLTENILKEKIGRPNEWQTFKQLNWDINFSLDLGNAYIYSKNDKTYCLRPEGIELTTEQKKMFNQLSFSKYGKESRKNALKGKFKYYHSTENRKAQYLDLENLYILSDLSNSMSGNWFKSNSRIDALYKVIKNSESSLNSKDINLDFSKKFLVSGQHDIDNQHSRPMGEDEKTSVENSLLGNKQIHVTKTKSEVKHMVSNLAQLKLDDSYLSDLLVIGNMYGMNRDVIDMVAKGSTYENKEKSFGSYIDYTKMPRIESIVSVYEQIYDIDGLVGTYEHLPFNEVFKAEKVNNNKVILESLKIAKELGLDETQIKNELNKIYS